jgi:predicted transposase/invertase (TIGR01784 family)
MEEITIERKQANKYDKIVKENMESMLPVFMKDVLNLDVTASVKIADDIQYTKERKPDLLAKITDRNNQTFVLHLEWQSHNDKNMVYRMAEYAVMLYRKYRLPVVQFVIFMGKGNVRMERTIKHKNLKFRYHIIALKDINYKLFLKSKNPGSNVFAILCNFENDDEDKAVENIVQALEASVDGDLERRKHFNQLKVFMQLCNDNIKLKLRNMFSVSTFYKLEDDFAFQEGVEKGRGIGKEEGIAVGKEIGIAVGKEEGKVDAKKQFAIRLKKLGYEMDIISQALDVSVEEVEKIQIA